jgi:hypothetical protein
LSLEATARGTHSEEYRLSAISSVTPDDVGRSSSAQSGSTEKTPLLHRVKGHFLLWLHPLKSSGSLHLHVYSCVKRRDVCAECQGLRSHADTSLLATGTGLKLKKLTDLLRSLTQTFRSVRRKGECGWAGF